MQGVEFRVEGSRLYVTKGGGGGLREGRWGMIRYPGTYRAYTPRKEDCAQGTEGVGFFKG